MAEHRIPPSVRSFFKVKLAIGLLALGSFSLCLMASEPKTWTLSTQAEFLKGKLHGVSLTGDGRIVLAPSFQQKADTGQAYIFSMAQSRSGGVYLGTGNEGKIFKLDSAGKLSELASVKEVAIYALAADADGRLYAGSSPDGKVYEVSSSGQAREFFDPKEKYIWAMAFDRQGNLLVGTGPRGLIFKVNRNGEGAPFYDSPETHVTALFMDGDDLLAGSSPNGYIYRIDSRGKGFVIYDSSLSEVKALVVDRTGLVYATAIAGSEAPSGDAEEPQRLPIAIGLLSRTAPAAGGESEAASGSGAPPASRSEGRRSEVYRISKDGVIETLLSSSEDLFYSLLVRNDGTVLVGSGRRGRLFSIDRNRSVTILVQAPEEQITGLVEQGSRMLAASSNLGRIFELSPTPSAAGWYESDVLDTKIPSRWGTISWRVEDSTGAQLEFYTRSGNTKLPDETWSDWAGPYRKSSGDYVQVPQARFLQWKLQFPEDARAATVVSTTNAVRSVTVSYLQQNVPPQIASITIHPPGIAFQQFPTAPSGAGAGGRSQYRAGSPLSRFAREAEPQSVRPAPRRVFQPGAQSISWEASDDNGDDLVYTLYFKGEGESNWKLLEGDLTETTYTIDSQALAAGTYTIKVVASDASANPKELALADEMVSRTFTLTNSPPRISVEASEVKGNRVEIRFGAESNVTALYMAEYSIDGGVWEIIYPKDGITDGLKEEFQFSVQAPSGEHTFGIRVTDNVGNVATTKVVASVME
ncbi:MAG: hypothetical protein HYX74_04890 [Acidobacteria bacterium]|nr:hypothetical protein [Acidobacteriota bacterium]